MGRERRARAEQLLTQVIANPATAAATRQRAEQLLMRWGLTVVAADPVGEPQRGKRHLILSCYVLRSLCCVSIHALRRRNT